MGRTIPLFQIESYLEEKDRKDFEIPWTNQIERFLMKCFQLLICIIRHPLMPIRIQPIFMSIIFHHYKQLGKLCKEIEHSGH